MDVWKSTKNQIKIQKQDLLGKTSFFLYFLSFFRDILFLNPEYEYSYLYDQFCLTRNSGNPFLDRPRGWGACGADGGLGDLRVFQR